jgi:Tfp pilus assembly protein PilO
MLVEPGLNHLQRKEIDELLEPLRKENAELRAKLERLEQRLPEDTEAWRF